MDRKEIKALAREKIAGNKWNILWPMLVIGIVFGIFSNWTATKYGFNPNTMQLYVVSKGNPVLGTIFSLIEGVITTAYLKYILDFVRNGKFDASVILDTAKEKWLQIIIATILMGLIIGLCSLLLVIPGIIMALAYSMVLYIVVDTDTKGVDALKASREMMKGHKWEYFVFGLSFIGWILLVPFTLGILLIWLIPYMTVAAAIYYDRLKSLK